MTDPVDLTPYTLINLRDEMNQRFDRLESRMADMERNLLAVLQHIGTLAGAINNLATRVERLESRLPADA